jgi:hypothetical protein
MQLLALAAYLLWIVGAFVLIAAAIMLGISIVTWSRGRSAEAVPRSDCGRVQVGPWPVRVSGTSAPGPRGLLRALLSGAECVWYRERVFRIHWTRVWRQTGTEGVEPVTERTEEQVWEWHSGPFAIGDGTGGVLVAPELLSHSTTTRYGSRGEVLGDVPSLWREGGPAQFLARATRDLGYPVETVADVARETGAGEWRDWADGLGPLLADGLLPATLLDRFADPGAGTIGYHVVEEIIRPGLPFNVFARLANLGGQPILATPHRDVSAISRDALPAVMNRGRRLGDGHDGGPRPHRRRLHRRRSAAAARGRPPVAVQPLHQCLRQTRE